MKEVTIISNQSLLDIAIQELGSVDAAIELAITNGLSITSDLKPGDILTIPDSEYSNRDIVNYFNLKKQKIATLFTDDKITEPADIGNTAIAFNFTIG